MIISWEWSKVRGGHFSYSPKETFLNVVGILSSAFKLEELPVDWNSDAVLVFQVNGLSWIIFIGLLMCQICLCLRTFRFTCI
jgi:hypothetical protein